MTLFYLKKMDGTARTSEIKALREVPLGECGEMGRIVFEKQRRFKALCETHKRYLSRVQY